MIKKMLFLFVLVTMVLSGCAPAPVTSSTADLSILAGSEGQSLEPFIKNVCAKAGPYGKKNFSVYVTYDGSVNGADILSAGAQGIDVFMPPSSLWISYGDTQKLVGNEYNSTSTSFVNLWVAKSAYDQLGWAGKDVLMKDVKAAMKAGILHVGITTPGMSNSGTQVLVADIYSEAGNPAQLKSADLQNQTLKSSISEFFSLVDKTAESSGFLRDTVVNSWPRFNAMFNYESLGIEANNGWDTLDENNQTVHHNGLIALGKEPLIAVYVKDALAVVDFPIAYINHGDENKRAMYKSISDCLMSPEGQAEMLRLGRRAVDQNLTASKANPQIFNKDWGVDLGITVPSARLPQRDILAQILNLYRGFLKKPSFTTFCLDYSGSMQGNKVAELKKAMETLLNQDLAAKNYLQRGPTDITAVMIFDSHVRNDLVTQDSNGKYVINPDIEKDWVVSGNDKTKMDALFERVNNTDVGDGTAMYSCALSAYRYILAKGITGYNVSVVFLTDGESNEGASDKDLEQYLKDNGILGEIPGYGIGFNLESAGKVQLDKIASLTRGKVYKADDNNLKQEMRLATGNN
jgi:Ca-activated chloride channel family protein